MSAEHQYDCETSADQSTQAAALRELRDTRAELATIVENASDLIMQLDLQGRIVFANRSVGHFFGAAMVTPLGRSLLDAMVDEDAALARQRIATLVATPGETTGEVRMHSQAGVRVVEWHCRTITTDAGRPTGIIAVGRDVTAARVLEDELRNAGRRLEEEVAQRTAALTASNDELHREILERAAVEEQLRASQAALMVAERLAGVGRWEVDLVRGSVKWSEHVYQMYGLNGAQPILEMDTWLRLMHPDDRERMSAWSRVTAVSDEETRATYRIVRAGGEVRIVQCMARMLRDGAGKPARVIGTVQDVTELRRNEQQLREAQRIGQMGNWDWDIRSGDLKWSDEIYRIFGVEPQSFGATYEAFLQSVHEDDRPAVGAAVDAALRGEEPYAINHRIVRPDGEVRLVHERAEVRRDDEGSPVQMFGTVQDLTEHYAAAEALRIAEMRRREVETLAATGRMAARVAHEINNPLAGIKNAFQLVKPAVPKEFIHYHYVGRIENEIERISGIVRQMFDLYRPVATHDAPADLRAILHDMSALLAPSLRERGIEIADELVPDASRIAAPESMLRPAIFNVLQNAFEASPAGGTITVQTRALEDGIELCIADQGTGIPEADSSRIFEPFFTTKDGLSTGGLGLGLSIAKSTIEALGGTIVFEPRAEGGTEFRIKLPRARTQNPEDER